MSSEGSASEFRLNVLNPDGRDPEQDFRERVLDPRAHAPVNFHAYAACCGGFFLREVNRAIAEARPVLLLLRGDFRASERALAKLKKAGLPVAVSLKETGLHQIAGQLDDRARLTRFSEIVRAADGYVAPTLEAADLARTLREDASSVEFIPTPYPLHDPQWDLSRPVAERQGIFLGTREWNVPSRNHAAALLAAKRLGEPVTVYCCEGRREERLLAALDFRPGQLLIRTRRDSYRDYLRVVAGHKIVWQLDTSFVPGQVAGDALLCRLPCVGGNGAIERVAFPEWCGHERRVEGLLEAAGSLLGDAERYAAAVEESQRRAAERLSFAGAARELERFFARIAQS